MAGGLFDGLFHKADMNAGRLAGATLAGAGGMLLGGPAGAAIAVGLTNRHFVGKDREKAIDQALSKDKAMQALGASVGQRYAVVGDELLNSRHFKGYSDSQKSELAKNFLNQSLNSFHTGQDKQSSAKSINAKQLRRGQNLSSVSSMPDYVSSLSISG